MDRAIGHWKRLPGRCRVTVPGDVKGKNQDVTLSAMVCLTGWCGVTDWAPWSQRSLPTSLILCSMRMYKTHRNQGCSRSLTFFSFWVSKHLSFQMTEYLAPPKMACSSLLHPRTLLYVECQWCELCTISTSQELFRAFTFKLLYSFSVPLDVICRTH